MADSIATQELQIHVRMENALLRDDFERPGELAAILRRIASEVEEYDVTQYQKSRNIWDTNGALCGTVKLRDR